MMEADNALVVSRVVCSQIDALSGRLRTIIDAFQKVPALTPAGMFEADHSGLERSTIGPDQR
jgi:hypothetical protein